MTKNRANRGKACFIGLVFAPLFSLCIFAQTKLPAPQTTQTATANIPKVTQVDGIGLKKLLKPNGKPLLVNFWATWCDPCREEFPDLVKINEEYRGKIDFITISLDDLEEINRGVPKFLTEMRADMPAFLLWTQDESAAISAISQEYRGGLPFTIFFDSAGKTAYQKQGKVRLEVLRGEIENLLPKNVK